MKVEKVYKGNGVKWRDLADGEDKYSVEKITTEKLRGFYPYPYQPDMRDITLAKEYLIRYRVTDDTGAQNVLNVAKREIRVQGAVEIDKCGVFLNKICAVKLADDTDINDINSVRYQLGNSGNAKKIGRFIDRFVIVTPEEKKAYKAYVRQMKKKALEARRDKRRKCLLALRAAKEEAKQNTKAGKIALEQKIKEKFFGRK